MKAQRLFQILNELDTDLINSSERIPLKRRKPYLPALATAASLFLLIGIGKYLYTNRPDPSLPKLELNPDYFNSGGCGFSGCHAYDISELVNSNPWTEDCSLTALPVFRNNHPVDGAGAPLSRDWEYIDQSLRRVAGYFGVTDLDYLHTMIDPVTAQVEGMEFKISHPTDVEVFLNPTWEIPEEYRITGYRSTYEEAYSLAEYLLSTYPELIPLENPTINIWGGDYGNSGTDYWQDYDIGYYETTEDETQNILNYNFNQIRFYSNDEGNLWIYRAGQIDIRDMLGYYPIISADEAQKLLCKGYYGTNVPEDFPGEKYIAKKELIYRNDIMQDIYIPYYEFYVELPEEYARNGQTCYGLYYVPAIEGKYIEDFLSVWNIRFN